MARLEIGDSDVTLRLGTAEKVASLRGDLTFARSDIEEVSVVDSAWKHVHGVRLGAGLPAVLVSGTFGGDGDGETVAVCHGSKAGLVITLRGTAPRRVVVTVDDPASVAAQLRP